MSSISVVEACGDSRVFREDGEKLRRRIKELWSDLEPVDVDFGHVVIASVSFFDEAIAVLALQYPLDVIKRRVKVLNITEPDRRLLNTLVVSRNRERIARAANGTSETGT